MQDYTYLIKALRDYYILVPVSSDKSGYVEERVQLTQDAVNAIEALQEEVLRLKNELSRHFY